MNDASHSLFKRALEQLEQAHIRKKDWSFGGGTVLMIKFDHRDSRDIDIFFRDPQLLSFISPRLNDANEASIQNYVESSNSIKLNFAEGEVDFIVGSQLSSYRPTYQKVGDNFAYMDHPTEIIAKKAFHRGHALTTRDAFDIATVYAKQREPLLKNAHIFEKNLAAMDKKLGELQVSGILNDYLTSVMAVRPGGLSIIPKTYDLCRQCFEALDKRIEMDKKFGKTPKKNQGLER